MRHYFSRPALVWRSNADTGGTLGKLRPIPGHPGGMHSPPPLGLLTAPARSAQRLAACLSGAIDTAVDLPAIAAPHTTTSQPHHAHTNRRPDPRAVCPSSQARRRRTPPSAGYSPRMRAVRHGVERGAGTKLPRSVRRRADLQVWQKAARLPRHAVFRFPPRQQRHRSRSSPRRRVQTPMPRTGSLSPITQ